MNLDREQIIKALECCSNGTTANCEHCPYEKFPSLKDTLALINELTEENEDWKAIAEQYQRQFEEAKADTVRELAERIVANFAKDRVHYVGIETPTTTYALTNWELEALVKDMLEGDDGT